MRSERAFTLVETVMTLLLLGILATVAIPNFFDMRDDARSAVTRDEMAALRRAIVGDSRVVAGGRGRLAG